jgi:hypothetical protein
VSGAYHQPGVSPLRSAACCCRRSRSRRSIRWCEFDSSHLPPVYVVPGKAGIRSLPWHEQGASGVRSLVGPRFPHGTSPWGEGARGDDKEKTGSIRQIHTTRLTELAQSPAKPNALPLDGGRSGGGWRHRKSAAIVACTPSRSDALSIGCCSVAAPIAKSSPPPLPPPSRGRACRKLPSLIEGEGVRNLGPIWQSGLPRPVVELVRNSEKTPSSRLARACPAYPRLCFGRQKAWMAGPDPRVASRPRDKGPPAKTR